MSAPASPHAPTHPLPPPRFLIVEDGVQIHPDDVHLVPSLTFPTTPPDSTSTDPVPTPTTAPLYLYYHLRNAEGHPFYTARLKSGPNHPDVGCQLCMPDPGHIPCLTSCGFDINFNALVPVVPQPPPPPPPAPVVDAPPAAKGVKGFMKGVAAALSPVGAAMANTFRAQPLWPCPCWWSIRGMTRVRAMGPVREVMELNVPKRLDVWNEHMDCCCVVVWIHLVHRVQKTVGLQVVAMDKEAGDAMVNRHTLYTLTAC